VVGRSLFRIELFTLVKRYKNRPDLQSFYPYIIKQQAFVGGACVCHGHFGGGACVCVNTGSSPKMEHAQHQMSSP
jgi:hypothetical protein